MSHTNVEPADPNDPPNGRRQTRVAHDSLKPSSNSAKPLWECGCGECPGWVDPLSDIELPVYAADKCPTPKLMNVARGVEAYKRYQASSFNSDDRTSLYERAIASYGHIFEADRLLQREYDDALTTAMITRRQSPLDDIRDWIPPVTLHSRLANTFDSVRKAITYQISRKRGLEYEYMAVTAHTTSCATPHQHVVLWINDPENVVTQSVLQPAVDTHVEKVPTAYSKDHRPVPDSGAITVQNDPDLVDPVPDQIGRIMDHSAAAPADSRRVPVPTTAPQYIASQHPHLFLGHVIDDLKRDVTDLNTLLEGGAVAWASPHRTVSSSSGVSLN